MGSLAIGSCHRMNIRILTQAKVLFLPFSVLWGSTPKLWKRQIIALAFVFFVGGLSIFAAIARFFVIYPKILRDGNANIVNTYELWALIEITTCQMAVCLPALRVYLRSHQTKNTGQSWNTRADVEGLAGASRSSTLVTGKEGENSSFHELLDGQKPQEEV